MTLSLLDLPPHLLTLNETRQVIGYSLKTLRRHIADGAGAVIHNGRLSRARAKVSIFVHSTRMPVRLNHCWLNDQLKRIKP